MEREFATTVEYAGITIGYNEEKNRWEFELDGKERKAESLANAKKAIDAPERKTVAPFEKFQVYFQGYWSSKEPEIVTVTSYADNGDDAWVVDSTGRRHKQSLSNLYRMTEENTAIFAEVRTLQERINALQTRARQQQNSLKSLKPPQTRRI